MLVWISKNADLPENDNEELRKKFEKEKQLSHFRVCNLKQYSRWKLTDCNVTIWQRTY